MKPYLIEHHGNASVVEAANCYAAIAVWQRHYDLDADVEPDSIQRISDNPVIRAN